jgi:hypothetical protein
MTYTRHDTKEGPEGDQRPSSEGRRRLTGSVGVQSALREFELAVDRLIDGVGLDSAEMAVRTAFNKVQRLKRGDTD